MAYKHNISTTQKETLAGLIKDAEDSKKGLEGSLLLQRTTQDM